jgi:imidazolonepropionase-like amidohydrolase
VRPSRFVLFAALLSAAVPASGQDLMIRNARVITCAGQELEGQDVRVENGKIAEIGPKLQAAFRVPTIDGKDKVVMPAFVMAHTTEGLDRPNELMEIAPFVSVLDSIDPSRPFFDDCTRDGVYTINIMPGDRTVVGGMGRIIRPVGRVVEEMTIVESPGLKLSMIPPPNTSNRAAHLAKLRAALEDAQRYLEQKERDTDTRPTGNLTLDLEALSIERRKAALVRLLKREIPAYVGCGEAGDVWRALELVKEYPIDIRLVLQPACWRAAPMIAKAKVPVIIAPDLDVEETDPETGKIVTRNLPKALYDAGVEFAVTARPSTLGQRYLWYQAAALVRFGIPRDVALKAVTLSAARAIGLEKTKGSLEPGKDADLLVLTADPLSGQAWVDTGVIEGRVVYERRNDRRLAEVLGIKIPDRN